jgi:UDP-2,4-diacetamido-2,4,6-trideoxy-beta-L-altropyranose hydrolase
MKSALFRADASTNLGAGHVMRCSQLANALVTRGWECTLAGRSETLEVLDKTHSWSGAFLKLEGNAAQEPDFIKANMPLSKWDLLVCDHYERGFSFETACRPWVDQILVIDDLPNRSHDADILLDQTYGRDHAEYDGQLPKGCLLLTGPAFALLGSEFKKLRPEAISRRLGPVERVLVCVGGGNPHDILSKIIKGIRHSDLHLDVDIIIGPMVEEADTIVAEASMIKPEPIIHLSTREMAKLMADADLAIGVAGFTSWERCCMGLPALIMTAANNQKDIAAALSKAEACRLVGDTASINANEIAKHLTEMVTHHDECKNMAIAASTICDGEGAEKVAIILDQKICPRDKLQISTKPNLN